MVAVLLSGGSGLLLSFFFFIVVFLVLCVPKAVGVVAHELVDVLDRNGRRRPGQHLVFVVKEGAAAVAVLVVASPRLVVRVALGTLAKGLE
jgi:hypothetical protein